MGSTTLTAPSLITWNEGSENTRVDDEGTVAAAYAQSATRAAWVAAGMTCGNARQDRPKIELCQCAVFPRNTLKRRSNRDVPTRVAPALGRRTGQPRSIPQSAGVERQQLSPSRPHNHSLPQHDQLPSKTCGRSCLGVSKRRACGSARLLRETSPKISPHRPATLISREITKEFFSSGQISQQAI